MYAFYRTAEWMPLHGIGSTALMIMAGGAALLTAAGLGLRARFRRSHQ